MNTNENSNLILIVILIAFVIGGYIFFRIVNKDNSNTVDNQNVSDISNINSNNIIDNKKTQSDIEVVATMNDEIKSNSMWCGTFQLIWNDLVNEVVKQDIKFEEQLAIVDNLNKQDFNENSISEEYYYKTFGLKTLKLKEEIEKAIKNKFNENSDILDDFDWSEDALDQGNLDTKRYFFYTMLKRDFSYNEEFTKLEKGKFAESYDDINYYGINGSTDDKVRNQVEVLYYNSKDDCAVSLHTKEGDQVILTKGNNLNTFNKIYEKTMKNAESFNGKVEFTNKDYLKVPEIEVKTKRKYEELENKDFYASDGDVCRILAAIQSINLKMDEKGGSIKSEAAMDIMKLSAVMEPEEEEPRYFEFDNEFTVFLVESGKEKPYFAAHITDITKFQ